MWLDCLACILDLFLQVLGCVHKRLEGFFIQELGLICPCEGHEIEDVGPYVPTG